MDATGEISERKVFAASLVAMPRVSVHHFIETARSVVPDRAPVLVYTDDRAERVFVYSTYFEEISLDVARSVRWLLEAHAVSGWFVGASPPDELLVVRRGSNGVSGVARGLWDFPMERNTYLQLNARSVAPWGSWDDILEALTVELVAEGLPLNLMLAGYDSLTAFGATSEFREVGRRKAATVVPTNVAWNDDVGVFAVDRQGIYSLPMRALSSLAVFEDLLSGYWVAVDREDCAKAIRNLDVTRYIVLTPSDWVRFSTSGHECIAGWEEAVLLLSRGVEVDSESLDIKGLPLVVSEDSLPDGYRRYIPDTDGASMQNSSGIECLAPGVYLYRHTHRRSPWDGLQSEWTIDSTSALSSPFPSVAVSRRMASMKANDQRQFVEIRAEERPHMHPRFTEIYYCHAGCIDIAVYHRGERSLVSVAAGQFAVMRPGVAHMVVSARADSNGEFRQICLQFPSRFHYPYHETKRNYNAGDYAE